MRAVLLKGFGGVDQMYIGQINKPSISRAPPSALVKVKAIGVNRADIVQRQGNYPPPPGESDILGLEIAGTIEEAHESSKWKPGDRVMALLSGGGYSEYCAVPESLLMPIPSNLSFEEAAAIPEVFSTAYQALFWLGDLKDNQSVLIHGGASGVGTAAIQLARKLRRDVTVVVTASNEQKLEACRQLGATELINYKTQPDFDKIIKQKLPGRGVDLIIDYIGGSYLERNIHALRVDGKMVLLGLLGGASTPGSISLASILMKRLSIIGSTLRSRSLEYRSRLAQELTDNVLPLFEDKSIRPVVDKVFPWESVADAHNYMERNLNIGKIILKVE